MAVTDIVSKARAEMAAIVGLEAESVSRISRQDGGWSIAVELLEHRAIPESGDVLATYEAALDDDGNIMQYQRVRRYVRGDTVTA